MHVDPLLVALIPTVFVAGFVDAIAGGGGLITVPAYLLAGIPPTFLLGTNKCVSTIGTMASTARYILGRRMVWPVVMVGIPCTLVGAAFGAHTVALLPQEYVRTVIFVALPIAAGLTLAPRPKHISAHLVTWRSPRLWWSVPIIGLSIGWYDGFFGPGTGSFLILAFYGLTHLPLLNAAAVGRLFNLASNAAALVTFILHGKVLYTLALPLALAGIAGQYCGSHLAIRRGDRLVRGMLMAVCAMLLLFLIWRPV
ncbi:MAG: TSUP family transporter [Deltaproteobacteria bacterium]|nr:TSUP family transporter [Deltaproteobacteria bacterium]